MSAGSVYLDFAATSAVRPPEVIDAVTAYLRDIGATPGRSGHARAVAAGRVALRCRLALAELFGIRGDPGRISFQLNATHALNIALRGLLGRGDALVRTRYDHNAVRRPAAALAATGVQERVISGMRGGGVDLDEADALLKGDGRPARLLVLPHASNVLGSVLPVAELAERAHAAGALVLLDAAQSAGHLPIDVDALGVDLLAFTGHKGLLGPQGVGGLWVREGIEVAPLLLGGTGGVSDDLDMPAALPDRLEAGSQNGPGIAGLLAGVQWVRSRGVETLHARESGLKQMLLRRLGGIRGLEILSPVAPDGVAIVTVRRDDVSPAQMVARLEREHGIQCRGGLHCAPETHRLLGSLETGAVRLSLGWATTEADVQRTAHALEKLSADGFDA